MNPLVVIIIVGGIVIIAVSLLIYLIKRGTFEPDSTNTQTREEREEVSALRRGDFTVPLRKRYKTLSGPGRFFLGFILVCMVGMAVILYSVLQSGKPIAQAVDMRIAALSVGVIGVGGGIRLERWLQARVNYLNIVYERKGQDPMVEQFPFMADLRDTRNGREVVKEVASSRLFALFWRFRQVGESRELRDSGSLPEDIIEHEVPDHAWELPNGDVVIRTHSEGDTILPQPTTPDKTYSSPNTLSDEEAIRMRQAMRQMRARLQSIKATNAELMDQLEDLQKRLRNNEYRDREQYQKDLSDLIEAFAPMLQDHEKNDSKIEPKKIDSNGDGGGED